MQSLRLNNESSRLSALLIGLFAASALLLGTTVYWIAARAMSAELGDFIEANVAAVMSGYRSEGLQEAIEVVHQLSADPNGAGRYLLQSPYGQALAGNLPPMTPRRGRFDVRIGSRAAPAGKRPRHELVQGAGSQLPDGSYLFVGESTERVARTRALIGVSLAWIVGATLTLAIAGGALLSSRFLRRVDAITRTCRAVVAGRFQERIPVQGATGQLDQLSGSINEMLDRIGALLDSLRQVSSDIAHDLRTPLTRLRQRLQTAQTAPDAAAQAQHIERALRECDQVLALFAALLRISQIESGMRLAQFAPVQLTQLLGEVAELYAPVAEDGGQQLRTELDGAVTLQADRTLLLQLFSNLLENAIRHAGPGAQIRLKCQRSASEAVVQVVDSGPGIPEAERDKVLSRFYRLERSRNTPGHGLGLALVAAIAKLHQYRLELCDAAPGLCVTLRIPLAVPAPRARETELARLEGVGASEAPG